MVTTTIRVDLQTRAALQELATATGSTLMETTRAAAEALRRERFGHRVVEELAALRSDPDAWADYLADAEAISVGDGIG